MCQPARTSTASAGAIFCRTASAGAVLCKIASAGAAVGVFG